MPIRREIGPFTKISGPENARVQRSPCIANSGSSAAFMAPSSTGKYSGRQPAITALTAAFSTVQGTRFGGINPIISSAFRVVPANIRATLKSVGGVTGRPSVQPRSNATSIGSLSSSTSIAREVSRISPALRASLSAAPGATFRAPQPGMFSGIEFPRLSMPVISLQSFLFQP